jgi:hypothetical protein
LADGSYWYKDGCTDEDLAEFIRKADEDVSPTTSSEEIIEMFELKPGRIRDPLSYITSSAGPQSLKGWQLYEQSQQLKAGGLFYKEVVGILVKRSGLLAKEIREAIGSADQWRSGAFNEGISSSVRVTSSPSSRTHGGGARDQDLLEKVIQVAEYLDNGLSAIYEGVEVTYSVLPLNEGRRFSSRVSVSVEVKNLGVVLEIVGDIHSVLYSCFVMGEQYTDVSRDGVNLQLAKLVLPKVKEELDG